MVTTSPHVPGGPIHTPHDPEADERRRKTRGFNDQINKAIADGTLKYVELTRRARRFRR
ncbi:hypothetical protein [Streptomyces sp. JNUCC 63]